MNDCLFCKIAKGTLPASKVYEDDHFLAFLDIAPQVQKHILLIPKLHVTNLNEVDQIQNDLLAQLLKLVPVIAKEQGLDKGYRLVSNCGPDARQSVGHLHFHIMGGQEMSGQMG